MHRFIFVTLLILLGFGQTALPSAGQDDQVSTQNHRQVGFDAKPFLVDEEPCDPLTAKWAKKAGLHDGRRHHSRYGLILEKGCVITTFAAAGADITGEHDITLRELGFDYTGYCGAGAPRFNVYTNKEAGEGYFVGCLSGTATPIESRAGWFRVRFGEEDFIPFGGETDPFAYGTTRIDQMEIIMDETGKVTLDNIDINGKFIKRP